MRRERNYDPTLECHRTACVSGIGGNEGHKINLEKVIKQTAVLCCESILYFFSLWCVLDFKANTAR